MRLAPRLLALLLVLGLAAAPVASAAPAAPAAPKVVVIVGPVGELTARYLARGEAAAREAERFTPNVVRVFTPDATWPAVRRALDGASLVVYLGHGNGWPSRYRRELFPPTQNGFGLNPVAGGGNDAHQYFGEGRIARDVRLAKNAVVLLHHLCYASGNTEPGLSEGTPDEARQRVDNYAAGFIAAGAAAVVAEGHLSPAWYVRQILSTDRTIERIWAASPSANGNTVRFESRRSPGFVGAMDPDQPTGGYYRSLVARAGLRTGDIGSGGGSAVAPAVPTLVGSGLELGPPYLKGATVAGSAAELWVPYSAPNRFDPAAALTVGVRWDPVDAPDVAEPAERAERITLVQPERAGAVVEPVAVAAGATRIRIPLAVPDQPGDYRLVLTLHDPTGVAFDAPSQTMLPVLRVRVTGELAASWLVEPALEVEAGGPVDVPVTIANVGAMPWGAPADRVRMGRRDEAATRVLVVGHWVDLDGALLEPGDGARATDPVAARHLVTRLADGLAPGATRSLSLTGTAPTRTGAWLLVLDVVVPGRGSLAALGEDPVVIRVTVR